MAGTEKSLEEEYNCFFDVWSAGLNTTYEENLITRHNFITPDEVPGECLEWATRYLREL